MEPSEYKIKVKGEPTQYDFDLWDTYQQLASCDAQFFQNQDKNTLSKLEAIIAYFADKRVGITVKDEELKSLQEKITRKTPSNDASEDTKVKAKEVFENFQILQSIVDLPIEMREEIFKFLEGKGLVKVSQTSKQLKEEIDTKRVLMSRILLEEAKTIAKQLNCNAFLYEIAQVQAISGDIAGAIATAGMLPDPSKEVEVLIKIAKILANFDIPKALAILQIAKSVIETLKSNSQKADALIKYAKILIQIGDNDNAKANLDIAQKITLSDHINIERLNSFVKYRIACGDIEGAKAAHAVVQSIVLSKSDKASKLVDLACTRAKIGDIEGANAFIERAIAAAEIIQDNYDKIEALLDIALAKSEFDQNKEANTILEKMNKVAEESKPGFQKAKFLIAIARVKAAYGDISGAKTTLESALENAKLIEDYEVKYRTLLYIAEVQSQLPDLVLAKETIELIADISKKIIHLVDIAKIQIRNKDIPGAIATLDSAAENAQFLLSIPTFEYLDIARAYFDCGEFIKANAICEKAILNVKLTTKPFENASSLSRIAVIKSMCGDVEGAKSFIAEALKTAKTLPESLAKSDTLFLIAGDYVACGNLVGEKSVLEHIQNPIYKAEFLIQVVRFLFAEKIKWDSMPIFRE